MNAPTYLDRFLDPIAEAFTPEMAQKIVDLRAAPQLEQEVEILRRKANDGTLTPAEEADYKEFVDAVDVISIIQAKARRFFAQSKS